MGAEAVVVFAEELRPSLRFVRKQFMQLGSKGRFLSAQFLALFTDELWRRNALHANEMAARLHDGLVGLPGVRVTRPRQANHVFVTLPREVVESLQQVAMFYVWDEATTEVRLLCSWDTTVELVDEFIAALAGGLNLWAGPMNLQDGSPYLADGEVATDQQVWYLPQLLEGMEGASAAE